MKGEPTISPMKGEPTIVVGDRKELTYLLSLAAELEHGLMCEYLYAAFSLKSTAGPGVRAGQLAAVERWRGMIFGIAGEEMLHWALVQNLLTAVGSAPYVSRSHMPHQARGYLAGVQVRLLPFGEAALEHFVYLERPEGVEGADAEGFQSAGLPLAPMEAGEIIPRGQDFARSVTCTAPSSGVWVTWRTRWARTGCSSARRSSRLMRRPSAGPTFGRSPAWRAPLYLRAAGRRLTLAQHRELLVTIGWLALLLGCLHYDLGEREQAEAARQAAYQAGLQAGHGEIVAWSYEMAAWFALTEGRYHNVVDYARAGQQHAGLTNAMIQLVLQQARGQARLGQRRDVHASLDHVEPNCSSSSLGPSTRRTTSCSTTPSGSSTPRPVTHGLKTTSPQRNTPASSSRTTPGRTALPMRP